MKPVFILTAIALVPWLGPSPTRAATPHLGFELTANDGRIEVTTVYPGTPAALMGIQPGDTIVKVDHAKATMDSLRKVFFRKRIGSDMHLTFLRGGDMQDIDVRIIDKDAPDSWEAATAMVEERVRKEFREAMTAYVAKYGPVRILSVEAVRDGDEGHVSVRIANASEHFLQSCDLEVDFLDATGRTIRSADQVGPLVIRFTKELPPADAAGTKGITAVESSRPVLLRAATTAVVTVKHVRLANGQTSEPAEVQRLPFGAARPGK